MVGSVWGEGGGGGGLAANGQESAIMTNWPNNSSIK